MLDTDIAIYAIDGRAEVLARLATFAPGEVALSALVHSQIVQGAADNAAAIAEIEELAGLAVVIAYDLAASRRYAGLLRVLGFNRRHTFDRMIAAHALSIGATLVTNNIAGFADISDLRLQNWAAPTL